MNKQKDVVDKWDNLAHSWTLKENVDYLDLTKVDYRLIQTKNLEDKLILDVGSGLPVKVEYFANAGGKLISIDISRETAKKVRGFIEESSLGRSCEVVIGDARRLPFKNRIFDLVVSYSTIDHIPSNYQEAVYEMARVGKREVVITTENKLQIGIVASQYYLQNKNKGVHPTLGYVHYFYPWELKKMMNDAGLIITRFDAQRFRLPIWPSYGANLLLNVLHILIGPLNRLFFLISSFCERRGYLKFLYQRIGFSSRVPRD